MVAKRKARHSPPWWVRAPMYAALWPTEELSEYRVSLHRRNLRLRKKRGHVAANWYCAREAVTWSFAALQRFWYVVFVFVTKAS